MNTEIEFLDCYDEKENKVLKFIKDGINKNAVILNGAGKYNKEDMIIEVNKYYGLL